MEEKKFILVKNNNYPGQILAVEYAKRNNIPLNYGKYGRIRFFIDGKFYELGRSEDVYKDPLKIFLKEVDIYEYSNVPKDAPKDKPRYDVHTFLFHSISSVYNFDSLEEAENVYSNIPDTTQKELTKTDYQGTTIEVLKTNFDFLKSVKERNNEYN